ncbi:hypothetical protein quinque_000126 [Culex quinquefasciatus]
MTLCIDHADAVEISDCIAESLFNETMVKLPDLGHSAQLQHKVGQPSLKTEGPQMAREERVQSLGRMDRLPKAFLLRLQHTCLGIPIVEKQSCGQWTSRMAFRWTVPLC